ncbi:MAG TPA: adenylate/guanylate cyclase domain-containing protein, partial [Chloroflexia bacterium]|nr:adenylate/guanylate cyclase domain-containing protein [Chloroflexia bacterium]
MADPRPGVVTLLFAEIEGGTRLWETQPVAMQAGHARYIAVLQAAIAAHRGDLFKTAGDVVYAAFPTAPAGLAAALAAQRALQATAWDPQALLQVRIALHTGAVEQRAGDYFGPPLNRVARILAAGHGGQVLLSRATADLVRADLPPGVRLRHLGEQRLKDLIRPEHLFQLVAAGLPATFPPLRSLEAFAHNLPIQLTSFIGRDREMVDVARRLVSNRLLTLVGTGGTGKTRLSLQVAAELLDLFPDGVWLVELAPLTDAALLPYTVAAVLSVREEPGQPLPTTLTHALRAKDLLLVLDNCEHLLAACAALARSLLESCPTLRILASSREPLGVGGETLFRVPSLGVPPDLADPAILAQSEAVRLFVDRATAVQSTFRLTAANAPAVVQICRRLDGIPLALELAAARVKVLTVDQIAARLDDRFRLLTGGSRTALPRQQTLRALVDWSWDLLTAPEQALLRRLAVFAGGWTEAAAAAVGRDEPVGSRQYAVGSEDEVVSRQSSVV